MRRDSQPSHVTTHTRVCIYTCVPGVNVCPCLPCTQRYRCASVIYVYVGAGANAHSCVRMHVHVQGMDRRSRASLPLRPHVSSFSQPPCLSIPPTSRLSFTPPPSPLSARSFFHSFSLYLSTTRGVPFLPLVLCPDDRRFNVRDLTCLAYLQTSA